MVFTISEGRREQKETLKKPQDRFKPRKELEKRGIAEISL